MTTIDDILVKNEEVERLNNFIRNIAKQASDERWVTHDPAYTNALAVYNSAKAALIALVGSFP